MTEAKPSTPLPLSDVPEPEPEEPQYDLGAFGMKIFLTALGVLFAATIIGYFWTRSRAETWPPPGMPSLPLGLWISTLIILYSSVTVQWALRSIRKNRQGALRRALATTSILGLAFLATQTHNWWSLFGRQFTIQTNLYSFLFYLLTGLHAAHVLGGLIPLGIVTAKAFRGEYSSVYHPGVKYVTMYWHFLDVVWVILFVILETTM